MTAGYSAALADQMLDLISSWWAQLHTDDPGPAGTSNVSSVTSRVQVNWNAAADGLKTMANAPQWTAAWTGTSPETITFLSFWDASSGGNFKFSLSLDLSSVTVVTNAPLTLSGLAVSFSPLEA